MSVAGDTKGKTLPARAYTSPEVYEAEMREVFLKSWNFACHVSDVAEPGRFWTTTIASEPIAVPRFIDYRQLRGLRAAPAGRQLVEIRVVEILVDQQIAAHCSGQQHGSGN
jgi:hypothetical protein